MAIIKAEGAVIRSMKMGETSKLVTLYTAERGLLKLVAKGSRSAKSRFGAALEPLTISRVVYYEKEGRELQFLSQADIIETFPQIQADLEKWGYASACCEIILRTHSDSEVKPHLYPIFVETLRAMDGGRETLACFWSFQMKLLGILGIAPTLKTCFRCGSPELAISRENYVTYRMEVQHGGFLCENCGDRDHLLELSGEAWRLLGDFQALPATSLLRHKISPIACKEIENFFRAYFAYHLQEIGKLASLKFVREIKHGA